MDYLKYKCYLCKKIYFHYSLIHYFVNKTSVTTIAKLSGNILEVVLKEKKCYKIFPISLH